MFSDADKLVVDCAKKLFEKCGKFGNVRAGGRKDLAQKNHRIGLDIRMGNLEGVRQRFHNKGDFVPFKNEILENSFVLPQVRADVLDSLSRG